CQGDSDRKNHPLAEFTIRGDGSEISFDGTVELPPALVQTWVDFPDSNCGLLFEKTDTYPHRQHFCLKDNDDNWFMNHPRLIVEYLDAAQSQVAFQEKYILPQTCALQSNYPNPFNPTTTIPLTISVSQSVRLAIFNITGQQICELFSGTLSAGIHHYRWNGRDNAGSVMPSGVYFAVLQAGNQLSTRRMMLMK
ncbi:T9SS type A sorting domain-containing protein, partial [bacterium]|nr:T9SS type A sorting domain-containing protein [bacterium]